MEYIQQLVAAGKLAEALEILKNIDPSNEITILQGRLNRLNQNSRMMIISNESANIERNRITASILDLAGDMDIPEEVFPHTPPPIAPTPIERSSEDTTHRGGGQFTTTQRPPKVPYEDDGKPLFNRKEKTKILFLSANPIDQARIQSGLENRKIIEELERGSHRDHFEFLHPQFAVTAGNLLRAMNDKPHIIHFSGHGQQGGILISTEDNRTQKIKTSALKRLFRRINNDAKCVILSSCYSAKQAEVISTYGMFVIGFNVPVADSAAISFATGFYNGLGEGNSFQNAYDAALFIWENESRQSIDIIEVWKDGQLLDL